MKPKHPKRLYFRKVKRRPRQLLVLQLHRHLGNYAADVAGCILLRAGEAFRVLARSIETAAAGISAAAQQLGVQLGQPRHLVRWPASYTGTIQLSADEARGLAKLASG